MCPCWSLLRALALPRCGLRAGAGTRSCCGTAILWLWGHTTPKSPGCLLYSHAAASQPSRKSLARGKKCVLACPSPYSGFSSPPDDDCTNSFTPNQVARMHCYLDLVYQRWGHGKKPAPIPIPPMVTGQTQDSLSIHWLPPISGVIHER